MALFIYLWCLLGIPIAAIRSDLDTGDTLETDEASVREFDLQRRMGLNATGLERLKANLTVHQEKPPTVEELPAVWQDRMKIAKELGSGAFGRIYQLAATCDGTKDHFVSMKFMVKDSDAFREVKALRRMKDSKHVISTVGKPDYLETSDSMYILTPFMNSGDLLGLMKKCVETDGCRCSKEGIARTCWDKIGGPYSNAYVLALFYQAVLGVQDMHSKGLVHMDIKLENIMMNCVAGKCSAYIIDLGVSAEFGTRMPSGTPGYMVPEVLNMFGSSQPQNDIFSLGVVLYMFVYGEQPAFFRDGNTRNYDPTKDTIIPQSDNAEQSEIDRLVISMLNNDYKSRIDTPEILQRLMYVAASLATKGDLFTWCDQDPPPGLKREAVMLPIVGQIFVAVRWLHDLGVAHRDLSLENILLSDQGGTQQVKLIDFGMATVNRICKKEVRGKQSYQAPEMHGSEPYDAFLTDEFALGVSIFAMAVQDYPWTSTKKSSCQLFEYISTFGLIKFLKKRKLRKGTEHLAEVMSPELIQLIDAMVQLDANNRLSLGEACFNGEARRSVWDEPWIQAFQGP